MGRKCSIPGCREGYDSQKAKGERRMIFSFPSKDDPEERRLWLSKLPNTFNFNKDITNNMGICSRHWTGDVPFVRRGRYYVPTIPPNNFAPEDTTDTTDASMFHDVPAEKSKRKKRRQKKMAKVQDECKNEVDEWMATDKVTDFKSFCDEAKNYLGGDKWTFKLDNTKEGKECIRFNFMQNVSGVPDTKCLFTVTVLSDMHVKLFSELSGNIPDSSLNWIFGNQDNPPVLVYWSQFTTLISQCSSGLWVGGNDCSQRVYVNHLNEMFIEDEEEPLVSFDKDSKDAEGTPAKHAEGDEVDVNEKRLEILRLTQELYSVIFQRNQLMKKMKYLQELSSIDLDLLSLILNVQVNPAGRAELDKVFKLVHVIMMENEEINGKHTAAPIVTKKNQTENDTPLQKKTPSVPKISSTTKVKSNSVRKKAIDGRKLKRKVRKENYKHYIIKNTISGEQYSFLNNVQSKGVKQENGVDENVNRNSDPSKIGIDDGDGVSMACEYCGKTFFKMGSLRKHVWIKHRKGSPIECNICNRKFRVQSLLEAHMVHHTDEKHLQCSVCGKTFKWQRSFDRHRKYAHTEERPFKCSVCNKGFKQKEVMIGHEKLHMKKRKLPAGLSDCEKGPDNLYHCKICSKGFHIISHLQRHMARHSDARPFKCSGCEKSFKRIASLRDHEQNVHSEDRPYKCSVCPKRFKLQSRLESHEKAHTDKQPFNCEICGKTFKGQRSLDTHQAFHLEGTASSYDQQSHQPMCDQGNQPVWPDRETVPAPVTLRQQEINPNPNPNPNPNTPAQGWAERGIAPGPVGYDPREINTAAQMWSADRGPTVPAGPINFGPGDMNTAAHMWSERGIVPGAVHFVPREMNNPAQMWSDRVAPPGSINFGPREMVSPLQMWSERYAAPGPVNVRPQDIITPVLQSGGKDGPAAT